MIKSFWIKLNMAILVAIILFAGANVYAATDDQSVLRTLMGIAKFGEVNGAYNDGAYSGVAMSNICAINEAKGTITIPYIAIDKNAANEALAGSNASYDGISNGQIIITVNGVEKKFNISFGNENSSYNDEYEADTISMKHNQGNTFKDANINFEYEYNRDFGENAYSAENIDVLTFATAAADVYSDNDNGYNSNPWGQNGTRTVFLEGNTSSVNIHFSNANTDEIISMGVNDFLNVNNSTPTLESYNFNLQRGENEEYTLGDNQGTEYKQQFFTVAEDGLYAIDVFDAEHNSIIENDQLLDKTSLSGVLYQINNSGAIEELRLGVVDGKVAVRGLRAGVQYSIYMPQGGTISIRRYDTANTDLSSIDDDYLISEAVEEYRKQNDTQEAEMYERIISWFIRLLGHGLNAMISLITGEHDLTVDKILFDEYKLTQLSLFKNDVSENERYYESINPLIGEGGVEGINQVFNTFRYVSLVVYMLVLLYIGIRILLISTVAEKKAKYKEMLLDWVKGVVILYFFPYIIRYAMLLNHGFVQYVHKAAEEANISIGSGIKGVKADLSDIDQIEPEKVDGERTDYMMDMYHQAVETGYISDTLCWIVMLIQVIQFLIVYLKRLITVVFLICIFPLVTITYAVDKVGDGKAQAFSNWCKEFFLQVFIQSFQAINYVLVIGIVLELGHDNWFLKIVGITYVAKGGDILRGLFAQLKGGAGEDGGPLSAIKSLAKTKAMVTGLQSIGKVASRTIGPQSIFGRGVGALADKRNRAIERRAVEAERKAEEFYQNSNYNPDGTRKTPSLAQVGTDVNTMFDDKPAEGATPDEKKANQAKKDKEKEKALNELMKASEEDLQRIMKEKMDSGQITEDMANQLGEALDHARATEVLRNRNGRTDVQVRTALDLIVRDRLIMKNNGGATTGNKLLDTVMERTKNEFSDKRVSQITAKYCMNFDPKAERKHMPSTSMDPTNGEDVRRSMRFLTQDVREGGIDYSEVKAHMDLINTAKASGNASINGIIKEEEENAGVTSDDLNVALSVYRINASNEGQFAYDASAQSDLDDSIRTVQAASASGKSKELLKDLNAKVGDLKVGEIPIVHQKEATTPQKTIQEELSKKLNGNDMIGKRGPEYLQYLDNRIDELRAGERESSRKAAFGLTVGGAAGIFKGVEEITVGGIVAGATSSTKDGDMIGNIVTVVPTAVSAVEGAIHNTGTAGKRIYDDAKGAYKTVKTKITKVEEEEITPVDTIKKSMDINRKAYNDEAQLRMAQDRLRDAEVENMRLRSASEERKRRLDKIYRGLGKK